ncbi:MAG: hypothetical protein AB8E82_00140 [Aureispira sp.]
MKEASQLIALLTILLLGLVNQQANAQNLKAYERAATEAFEKKSYYNAMYYYGIVLKSKKTSQLYYSYAQACRLSNAYLEAEEAYKKVIESRDKSRFPMLEYYYGLTLKHNAKYKEAKRAFKYFLESYQKDNFYKEKAAQEMKSCDFAQQLIKKPLSESELQFTHLGEQVNTKYSDFAAHEIEGVLYYSSLRFERKEQKGEKSDKKERTEGPMVAKILSTPDYEKEAGKKVKEINLPYANSGNSALSHDQKYLYFTRCSGKKTDSLRCEIFRSERLGNGKWAAPERLPNPINSNTATTTHPNLAWDANTEQEWLYFVSNRAGGQGDLDIWRVALGEDLTAVQPENLGPTINSKDAEVTPFYDNRTQRLYFASRWHLGLGGYDIFYSKQLGTTNWEAPVNMGLPFNSAANDLYFVVNADDTTGYLASNRDGSRALTKEACCNDIYRYAYLTPDTFVDTPIATVPPPVDTPSIAVVPPPVDTPSIAVVPPADTPSIAVVPPPVDTQEPPITTSSKIIEELDELLPLSLYFHNDEPDSNTRVRATTTPYEESYAYYLRLLPDYKQKYTQQYAPEKAAVEETMVQQFFDNEVRGEYNRAPIFLDKLMQALDQGLQLKVYIRGYTSPRADANYNIALAHRRVASLRSYMMRFNGGVLQKYLDNGQLILKEAMLGESVAPAGISDDLNDPANSIYSTMASRERKAEISVVILQ